MLKNLNEYEKGRTIVYFVRHGERIHIPNSPGAGLLIPGPGLTVKGRRQAIKVANELSKIKNEVDGLYSSDMARAIETAREISKKINKKPIIVEGISEFGTDTWKRQIWGVKFWKNYLKLRRAIKVFDRLLEKNKGKVIIIACHGNVIKALTFRKMGLSLKKSGFFHNMNCNISIARYNGKKLDHICCFNSNTVRHS